MALERGAAIVMWAYAAGFGLATIPVAQHLLVNGRLPMFLNFFPAFGGPWSTRLQPPAFVSVLGIFFVVTLLVATGAWMLWNGNRMRGIAALTLIPIEAIFWYGFALPIPPVLALVRVVLVIAGWKALS